MSKLKYSNKERALKLNPGLYCRRDAKNRYVIYDNDGHLLTWRTHAYLAWFEIAQTLDWKSNRGADVSVPDLRRVFDINLFHWGLCWHGRSPVKR